ncbi:MAG: hypothetical protein AAF846_26620 [Chloroflexota bacterium]
MSPIDGKIPHDLAERMFGEQPQGSENVIVCLGDRCLWSFVDPQDIDITMEGGDGIIPSAEPVIPPASDAVIPPFLFCDAGNGCQSSEVPDNLTADDIDLIVGPRPNQNADLVFCTAGGCHWTELEPEDVDRIHGGDGDIQLLAPPNSEEPTTDSTENDPAEVRAGNWFLVPSDIVIECPGLSTVFPVTGEPLPLNVDTLNAGTSIFGSLDQVLNAQGAGLLPPDVVADLTEADDIADELQTTDDAVDPNGLLFTNLSELAIAGETYTETFPVDETGEIDGEVLLVLTFDTDASFFGELTMNIIVPNVGVCDVNMPYTGYFEPDE